MGGELEGRGREGNGGEERGGEGRKGEGTKLPSPNPGSAAVYVPQLVR